MDNSNSEFMSMLSTSRDKALRNLEDARNYITIDLKNIASILSSYHPLEIARLSVWEARKVEKTGKDESVKATYRLLPILIQSVLLSDMFTPGSRNRQVKNKDWQRILSLNEDISRKLSRYIDNLALVKLNDGIIAREDVFDYRSSLYVQFFPSQKTHDIIRREKSIAESSFLSDRALVEKTFSVSPERLVNDLFDISDKALDAIDRLKDDVSAFKGNFEAKLAKIKENNPSLSEDAAMHLAYKDPAIRDENARLSGLRDDFDLFRPEFFSSISNETMDALSSELGRVDMLSLLFEEGLWSATCYPFIKLSGMHFTFAACYLLAIYQRFSLTSMNLGYLVSASAENALSSLFSATDVVGVYSINGRKVDVVVLSSLGEINLVSDPELWQQRMKRRSLEMEEKPQIGHVMLIVNPDGSEELEKLGDGIYLSSLSYLLKIQDEAERRIPFYEQILGPAPEIEAEENIEDEIFEEEEAKDDYDVLSDELTMEGFDDDEYLEDPEKEEDEEEYDIPDPMQVSRFSPSLEEKAKNERLYESSAEVIEEEKEKDVENTEFFDDDEEENDSDGEKYDDDFDDPDQLDFLDLLDAYDSDDEEEREKGEEKPSKSGILDLSDLDFYNEDSDEELYSEILDEEESAEEKEEEEKEALDPPEETVLAEQERKENVIKEIDETIEREEEEIDEDLESIEKEDEQSTAGYFGGDEAFEGEEDAPEDVYDSIPEEDLIPEEGNYDYRSEEEAEEDIEDRIAEDGLSEDADLDLYEAEDEQEYPEAAEEADDHESREENAARLLNEDQFEESDDYSSEEEAEEDIENRIAEDGLSEDADADLDLYEAEDEQEYPDTAEEADDHESREENAARLLNEDQFEGSDDCSNEEEAKEDIEDRIAEDEQEGLKPYQAEEEKEEEAISGPEAAVKDTHSGNDDDIVLEYEEEEEDAFDKSSFSELICQILENAEGDISPLRSFLESEDESVISYFESVIRQSWEKQQEDGKDKMFSVFEYDMSLLLSKGRIYDDLRLQELMNNAGAVMYSQGKSEWNALLLYVNRDYDVESARMIRISRETFTPSNWKIVTNIGDALIARRGR